MATKGQAKYRKAIEKLNIRNLSKHKIGDIVLLYVDSVHRNKDSPNNLICIVMAIKENNYKLGCNHGVLDRWYYSNAIRSTDHQTTNLNLNTIPVKDLNVKYTKRNPDINKYVIIDGIEYITITVRDAMNKTSLGGGQGYVRCSCTRKCTTAKCSCKKANIGCNTKCHPQTSSLCENKKDGPTNDDNNEDDV